MIAALVGLGGVCVLGASERAQAATRTGIARFLAGVEGFTPSSGNARLAALVGKGDVAALDYSFTPAQSRRPSARQIAASASASRAFVERSSPHAVESIGAAAPNIAPIGYNLGVAISWKKFALPGDASRITGSEGERANLATSIAAAAPRGTLKLHILADPTRPAAKTVGEERVTLSESIDNFRLTRKLDSDDGPRGTADRLRIDRAKDDHREGKTVFLGAALRF